MEQDPGGGGSVAGSGGLSGAASSSDEPRDARVVKELLRSMGVQDGEYEPHVIHQFLELCYRYIHDILSDAQVYSDHASKSSIDPDDVRLAIQAKVNFSFSQPPPREVLLELARSKNKMALPKSIAPPGSIPLPSEEDTLLSPNYQLLILRKQQQQPPQLEETEEEEENMPNSNANDTFSPEQRMNQPQQAQHRISFPLTSGMKIP